MQKSFEKVFVIFALFLTLILLFVSNSIFYLKDFDGNFEVYREFSSSTDNIQSVKKEQMLFMIGKKGEGCFLSNNMSIFEILKKLNADVVFEEEILEGKSYYCYSKDIKHKTMVKGEVINLQVCISQKGVKIGTPLIYGSF